MNFTVLKSKYIDYLKQNGKLAELTIRNYANDINTFERYLKSQNNNIGKMNQADFSS